MSNTPNWFAEIEMRRWWRDKIPEEEMHRRLYPTEPKPDLAQWWSENDYDPNWGQFIDQKPPQGVDINNERILVPLETTRALARNNTSITDWVYNNIFHGMLINESPDGSVMVGGKGDFGQKRTKEIDGVRGTKQFTEYEPTELDTEPDPRPVYVQLPPDHQLTELSQMWSRRRAQDRDMKVIVTARDSATGTGKTTLAVALAKSYDAHGWNADKATLSPETYVEKYTELDPGEILLGDEAEQMADPRRAMTSQNITLTQYWATMRQWQVSTIVTLPSPAMIDNRLKELMDVRINVQRRGLAVAYKKKVDDHSGQIREKRMHRIRWDPLDGDPDFQELARKKKRRMENFNEKAYYLSDDGAERQDPEEAIQEYRNEQIRYAVENTDFTQKEIAQVFDLSRPRVSQIANSD